MSLLKSFATISGFTLLSRLLGFVRDICIAGFLGASLYADAFFVAWRFPNLFRSLFAEGTLNVSFLPLFSSKLKNKQQAELFANEAFSCLLYILCAFVLIMEVFMPEATFLFAPGFKEISGKLEITTFLSRITFPFLIFVSLVSLLSGMLNAVSRFAAAAFVPCLMNIVMIVCLYVLPLFKIIPAEALSCGVLFSGIIELIFLFFCVRRAGFHLYLISPLHIFRHISKELKTLFRRMLPGILGSGVYQINLFLDTFFVSLVGAGATSWLFYAHHLFQLPVGMIGVAIGTALLPVLSCYISQGKMKEAVFDLNRGLELSLAFSVASMVGLFVLSTPIIVVLFQRKAFTAEAVLPTAYALQAFSVGLPAYMLTKALSQFFYAKGDTKTPVKVALVGLLVNVALCLVLMTIAGHVGIALATGLSVWVNAGQYIYLLTKTKEFSFDGLFWFRFKRILFSAFVMGCVLVAGNTLCSYLLGDWPHASKWISCSCLIGLICLASIIYFVCLLLTKGILFQDLKMLLSRRKIK